MHSLSFSNNKTAGLYYGDEIFTKLYRYFEHELLKFALELKSIEQYYPTTIPRTVLKNFEVIDSFPQHLTYATTNKQKKDNSDYILSSAVCYHCYYNNIGAKFGPEIKCYTAQSSCFRYEGSRLANDPSRLWEFNMREIIFFGSSENCEMFKKLNIDMISRFMDSIALPFNIVPTTDIFFGDSNKQKKIYQKIKELKIELQVSMPDEEPIAIASINLHEQFFTNKMHLKDSPRLYSGCVAFGIERWAYTFLKNHGRNSGRWPEPLVKAIN